MQTAATEGTPPDWAGEHLLQVGQHMSAGKLQAQAASRCYHQHCIEAVTAAGAYAALVPCTNA